MLDSKAMAHSERLAVYPGSFDPLTKGHLDLIERASKVFAAVVVAVSNNPSKKHTFSAHERIQMAEEAVRRMPNVDVDTYSGLIIDYLKSRKARILIRGLRAVSDMEYEFQLASMNRRLYSEVETVFLMPDEQYTYLSSSIVKEVSRLGASPNEFVSPNVARILRRKFRPAKRR